MNKSKVICQQVRIMKHIHAIGMIDRTIYCGEYKEGTATLFRNFRIWTK
ncbi:MAG: hypothetical protein AAB116_06975 [Candidatus Poribacteria bacterium]